MAKYHINKKGEPGICRATRNCPFGDADHHYDSKEGAREAYEEKMLDVASRLPEPARKAVQDSLLPASGPDVTQEKEMRMEVVPADKIKEGDLFQGESVTGVNVGRKWVTLSTDTRKEILVAKDSEATVIREDRTDRAKASERTKWQEEYNQQEVEKRISALTDAQERLNRNLNESGSFHHGDIDALINAQAKADIASIIQRRVDDGEGNYTEVTDALRQQYHDRIGDYEIRTGLSRSTSVTSNAMEDAKSEAILEFIRRGFSW